MKMLTMYSTCALTIVSFFSTFGQDYPVITTAPGLWIKLPLSIKKSPSTAACSFNKNSKAYLFKEANITCTCYF